MSIRRTGMWPAYRPLLLLAIVSMVGLVSALVADGVFDALSWLTLGTLVALVAWYAIRWR